MYIGKGKVSFGTPIKFNQVPFFGLPEMVSPETYSHQGVTTDGTYYYTFDGNIIRKWDMNWNHIAANWAASADLGLAVAGGHIGDGCNYDGKLYAAAEIYTGCGEGGFSDQCIAVWNTSDLSFVAKHDISAQAVEVSSCAVDGAGGKLYVSSYCATDSVFIYSLADFSYVGALNIGNHSYTQGITYKDGYLWISKFIALNNLVKIDATTGENVATYTILCNEGIDYTSEKLLGTHMYGDASHHVHQWAGPVTPTGRTVEMVFTIPTQALTMPETAARLWNDETDNSIYLAPITWGQLIFKSVHTSGNTPRPNIPNTSIIPNKTHHVVAVDDLISTKLYLDGKLVQSVDRDGSALSAATNFCIGSYDAMWYPSCDISKVRYYYAPLSASDIADKYQQFVTGKWRYDDIRCVGDYDMIPVAGRIPDQSGNSNHGTLSGEYHISEQSTRTRR